MSTTDVNDHTNIFALPNILAISAVSLAPRNYLGRIIPYPQLPEEGRPHSPSSPTALYFYHSSRYFFGSLGVEQPPRSYPHQHKHQQLLERRFELFAIGEAEPEIQDFLGDPFGHTVERNLDE